MRRFFRPVPLAVTGAACVLVYTLVGFLLVPYLIKTSIVPMVSEKLRKPVLIREAEFNPFKLALRLTGFEIREADLSPLIGFDEFFVNFRAISLIRQAYVFDTIRFTVPYVAAKVSKEGQLNLANIVPPDNEKPAPSPTEEKKPAGIPAIEIGEFEIAQGIVEFRDESKPRPYSIDIVPIHIVLKNFHTKPGGDNAYSFTAELGKGETLSWSGKISLEPIQSTGTLTLSGIKLQGLWKYLHDRFQFDISDGVMHADARYQFDAGADPIQIHVSDANLHIERLAVKEDGTLDPVITIPQFRVKGVDVDVAKRDVAIQEVAVERAAVTAWLNPEGTVNLQQLFAPADSASGTPTADTPTASSKQDKPWAVFIKDVLLKDHAIDFEDRTLSTPARIEVRALTAKTRDIKIPIAPTFPVDVELELNRTGTIQVKGAVMPDPLQIDATVTLKDIAIRPFQPYFDRFARIEVQSGSVNVEGTLNFAAKHPNGPLLSYGGNASVIGLSVAEPDRESGVLSLKALGLTGIRVSVDPTSVMVQEVGLQQPAVHLVVQPDGALNLGKLAVTSPSSESMGKGDRGPSRPMKTQPVPISIGVVKLVKGAATFRDESVQPAVSTGLYDISGSVKGLSSRHMAKADVDISGRVDKIAPLKITGQINPLTEDAFTDLTIKFDNVDLLAASPYSGKYAGYPIKKGKLFLDLAYKISQKQLEAENKVSIDQLTFGDKTDSPDAVSLPVPLAVALLKDRKGRIDIDLPIRGDLKDPDFKYGKVVWSTLLNLLGKIVASPFTLMGKLIPGGGDGEDLQFAAFEPGSSELPLSESKKLDALVKGLTERPGLRLEITGKADPVRDRQSLAQIQLQSILLARWRKQRDDLKETAVPAEQEDRLVRELFKEQTSSPPATAVGTAPSGAATSVQPPTVEDMKRRLVSSISISEDELRTLARQRAEQLRRTLTGDGKLADERVYLTEVILADGDHEQIRSALAITAGS